MTELSPLPSRARIAVFKVIYLLAVTAAVFAVPAVGATRPARWYVTSALLLVQIVLLLRCGIPPRDVVRSATRLKWLFAILLVCYAFLPGGNRRADDDGRQVTIPLVGRSVGVNLGGLSVAARMCTQIVTVILASAVVRLTGPGTDLVDGLRALGMPDLFVHSLDQTLGQLGGMRRQGRGLGDGSGGRRREGRAPSESHPPSPGFFVVARRAFRGDVGFFIQSIRGNLERPREEVRRDSGGKLDDRLTHDVSVVTGIALVMASLKMVESLPGIPFAPGHKTLLLYPLYVLASRLAHSRWGGTSAGAVMGMIGFLQGNGRFGVLDVLRHLAPGLVIDLLMPLVTRLPPSAAVFCGLGFLAAVARTATEFAVVVLLGARAEVYLFPAARLVPNLVAGTLSGFITAYVLRAFLPNGQSGEVVPGTERAVATVAEPAEPSPKSDPSSRPDLMAARSAEDGDPRYWNEANR